MTEDFTPGADLDHWQIIMIMAFLDGATQGSNDDRLAFIRNYFAKIDRIREMAKDG